MITLASRRTLRGILGIAVLAAVLAVVPGRESAADEADSTGLWCGLRSVAVPIDEGSPANQIMTGTMCWRGFPAPPVVHLLISGATYNRHYWQGNWFDRSYLRAATNAGYAVFAVDRIGTGSSSKPASPDVTLTSGSVALEAVVAKLRSGAISPRAFTKVVVVAHSLGAAYAWKMGNSADAVVASAELHRVNHPAWEGFTVYPAVEDPKWDDSGLDIGYQTTWPQVRETFYHNAPASIIQEDELTKDLATNAEFAEVYPLVDSPDPSTSPSRLLTTPVLVVIGEHDPFFCGGDSITCTDANVTAQESPHYANASSFTVEVLPDIGHSMSLHPAPAAATFYDAVLDWTAVHVPASG